MSILASLTRPTLRPQEDPGDNVVILDERSPPIAIPFGEDFLYEKLPPGTRVIYAPPPLSAVPDVGRAIRYAISHPEGCDPLAALLRPGMKVTIALDDISLPLPAMRTPDVRQSILEVVLELLADNGVDDIELVIAVALHRHLTPSEMKRMVGKRIFDAFYPSRYYNHDAENAAQLVELGRTPHGERVIINRRVAESDLVIYANINLVPMDGGHKSIAVGLTNYDGLRNHHNPRAVMASNSYMDPKHSAMHASWNRMGKIVMANLNVFTIETTINNEMFGPELGFLARPEHDWSATDTLAFRALRGTLAKTPRALKRSLLFSIPAAYGVTGVVAGCTADVHPKTMEACYAQYTVPVNGQADILVAGVSFICPYNVNSIMNPLLVHCTASGYYYNMYRDGVPLLRDGGVMIVCHPLYDEFHSRHHAPYIEFFHRLLSETRDSAVLEQKYEEEFARNPAYVHMYRHENSYHGAHPFYMWYWGEAGRRRAGKTIVVGAESATAARILGWDCAGSVTEAIEMARTFLGRRADATLLHLPPLLVAKVNDPKVVPHESY